MFGTVYMSVECKYDIYNNVQSSVHQERISVNCGCLSSGRCENVFQKYIFHRIKIGI